MSGRTMGGRTRLAAVLVSAGLAVGLLAAPAISGPTLAEEKLKRLINDYRQSEGKAALSLNAKLRTLAHDHSEAMAAKGELFHSTEAQLQNYHQQGNCKVFQTNPQLAEIIGNSNPGPHTVDTVLGHWKASPEHDAELLRGRWKKMGVGVKADSAGVLWGTVIFCG